MKSNKKEDWINIDNYIKTDANAKNFMQADARELPLADEVADYIIADQVFEHLSMADVPMALYEIRRVLRKGGKAVIIVPDFRSAAADWMAYNWELSFHAPVYQFLSEVIYGNQNHDGEYHKTPFTGGYLHYILNMVGLREHVISFHPKSSPLPNFPGVIIPEFNAALRNSQIVAEITK
jgi:SAM-dependent methyltransferase